MNALFLISSLRKFGNFLLGLFPVLGMLLAGLEKKLGFNKLDGSLEKLKQVPLANAVITLAERFFWRDYSRDRIVLEQLPEETVPILKAVSLLAVVLTLLIPVLAGVNKPGVILTLTNDSKIMVSQVAIWLWAIAAAAGWSCLLAGAIKCNRWIYLLCGGGALYFLGSCALFVPRSYYNVILPVAIIYATGLAAANWSRTAWYDKLSNLLVMGSLGAPVGIFLVALTPLQPILKPNVMVWGSLMGIILTGLAQKICSERSCKIDSTNTAKITGLILLLHFSFLASLIWRGSPSPFAEQLLAGLQLWHGYLWPVWYFVSVGIIYKLLRNAKILSHAIHDVLPNAVFIPVAILTMVIWSLILWSHSVALAFEPTSPFAFLSVASQEIYKATSWFWSQLLNSLSAEWMRWILLFDLLAIAWLIVKKRLSSETVFSLLYFTVLAWLLISEYMFQMLSFGRSPAHSAILLSVFAMWLLWLFHISILGICSHSSANWPAAGRQILYCGFVILCLLEINARTIAQDFKLTNEIFLSLFRGIIDIGIPYFLYVYATRRLKELPVSVLFVFQTFCLGAGFTLIINALDKLAIAGWTIDGIKNLLSKQLEIYNSTGVVPPLATEFSPWWLLAKAIIFVGAMAGLMLIVKRQYRDHKMRGALIVALMSFAGGFASFAKTSVDLPLPYEINVLISPYQTSLYLDYNWLASYLGPWLAAMIFVLPISRTKISGGPSRWLQALAVIAAIVAGFIVPYLYPGQQVYLVSTGLLPVLSWFGCLLFLYLAVLLLDDIESSNEIVSATEKAPFDVSKARKNISVAGTEATGHLQKNVDELSYDGDIADRGDIADSRALPSNTRELLVSSREFHAIFLLLVLGIASYALFLTHRGRLVPQKISALNASIMVPEFWQIQKMQPSTGTNNTDAPSLFSTKDNAQLFSTLAIGTLPYEEKGMDVLLANLVAKVKATGTLPDFSLTKVERWDKLAGGSLACQFAFHTKIHGVDMSMAGATALIPWDKNRTEYLTVYCSPMELERHLADIKRIISSQTKNN